VTAKPEHPSLLLSAWTTTLRRNAKKTAVVQAVDGRSCTFRELDAGARAWLGALGIEARKLAGQAVVFAVPNGIAWLEIFLGLRIAGAVAVPMDSAEPEAAQARVAEKIRAGFWWQHGRMETRRNGRRFRDLATCLIKLTSGTTGEPRPLVFTDAQMLADGTQVTQSMGIRSNDTNYAVIPFGHSYGLGNLTLPLLAQGVPVVCGGAPLPNGIAEDFVRWRPTVLPSVPAVFRALAASDVPATALASLRIAISAGAPLSPEVARDFAGRFGRRIHGFYGSSETGGIAYDRIGAATLDGGVGRAMQGVRITPLAGGRIRICSAAVFTAGNRNRSGKTGCWVPADRADLDARGNLTLLGRRGHTVKIAGRRVNLAEVVARLRRLAGVSDAWVGVSKGAEPVMGAAVASGRTVMELRAELVADTATWKVPKKILVLPALPLTARGKIDGRAVHTAVFGGTA
jgi:acyl-coenzyme A synthetase/AMP-(fatty) acid ligase